MKKLIFASMIILLGAVSAFPASTTHNGSGFQYTEWNNEEMAPGASLSVSFSEIITADSMDFNVVASAGSITTANVTWQNYSGAAYPTEDRISGTPETQFEAPICTLTFYNQESATVNVTANAFVVGKGK